MGDPGVKVLFGDSSESNLEPNVLDVIVQLVVCSREVADAVVEWENLELQRSETTEATASIIADLDRFIAQARFGLRATAAEMKRPEMTVHGEEVVNAVERMVEEWRANYVAMHEAEKARIDRRLAKLHEEMLAAMERFVVLLRAQASERSLHRVLDGVRYRDDAIAEVVPGVRVRLRLTDDDLEQPRRVRTLVGKGHRLQVGTRRSRLRRAEEPNFVALDDLLALDVAITPDQAKLLLAKKPGSKDVLRIELSARGDGADGVAVRSGGTAVALPPADRPVLAALWRALQAEAERVVGKPATLAGLLLDDVEVEDAAAMLECLERFVEVYRPVVKKIAARSPNRDELTIKIERDGKREEAWIRRDELAQHYHAMPHEQRRRLTIAELDPGLEVSQAEMNTASFPAIARPHDGEHSARIRLDVDEQGAPIEDLTEDVSMQDIVVVDDAPEGDGCEDPARVRSR